MHHNAFRTPKIHGDVITLHPLPTLIKDFKLPSKGTTESPKKNNTNKFIRKKGTAASDIRASPGVGPSVSSSLHTVGSGGAQTQQLASLDTTYAPEIQCDYGGNIFEHQHARLRQLPIYDTEGKLVPTHEMWKELRPGTLVTLNTDLVCWIYNEDDKRRKVRNSDITYRANSTRYINFRFIL